MNYLRDRCEQLANFLREGILRGEYAVPLPSTRAWCQQLGVGRPTLLRALQVLASEGLITMTKRGAVLVPVEKRPPTVSHAATRVVRVLTHGGDVGGFEMEIIRLSEQLQLHGIRLVIESCNLPRLKTIASQGIHPWELCFLLSIPVSYQKHFSERKDSTLVLGFANPDSPLNYLSPDLDGSIRHATHSLLRQGVKHIVLIEMLAKKAGVTRCVDTFQKTCNEWRAHPITSEVHLAWNDSTSMQNSIKKIVSKIKPPCGIVIHAPISLGILVSNLLQKGFEIPGQVRIMALEYREEEVRFSVPVTHYKTSMDRYAKEVMHAALHYFETGKLPVIKKVLPMTSGTFP